MLFYTNKRHLGYNRLRSKLQSQIGGPERVFFNTFDIYDLVYEEANEIYGNVNFGSESW